jgi:signal transduction histidine kinase
MTSVLKQCSICLFALWYLINIADRKAYASPEDTFSLNYMLKPPSPLASYGPVPAPDPSLPLQVRLMIAGRKLREKGYNREALIYFQAAIPFIIMDGRQIDIHKYGPLLGNIGTVYYQMGDYEKATAAHLAALDHIQDEKIRATQYVNIGVLFYNIGDYDKALQYYEMALPVFERHRLPVWSAATMTWQGAVFSARKKPDSALYMYHKAYDILKTIDEDQINQADVAAMTLNNMANTYLSLNQVDSALLCLENAKEKFQKASAYTQCYILTNLGAAYERKGDDKSAVRYIEFALEKAIGSGFKAIAMHLYKDLSDYYGKTGQYEKAWRYEQEFSTLKEEAFNKETLDQTAKQEHKYHLALKDREIAKRELQIHVQQNRIREKNMMIAAFGGGALLLGIMFVILYRSNRHKQKLQKVTIQSMLQQQEITRLHAKAEGKEQERSRIACELHDGIVSQLLSLRLQLSAIQEHKSIIHPEDLTDVIAQLEEATRDLRKTAHNLMPDLLMKHGLVYSVAAFCEKITAGTQIALSFQSYGTLPPLSREAELSLFRIIQELIQNVLKHAQATEILVQLACREASLNITVEDNGIGIPEDLLQQESEMFFRSLRQRISDLGGTGFLDVKRNAGAGTTIYLEFDLNTLTYSVANQQ